LKRPTWDSNKSEEKFYEYLYLRNNVAGIHKELWFHQYGDRSWLVVTRNTISHEITKVELAADISKKLAKANE
jgi:heterotetrameric sarcosine oxidase delta subunit